MAGRAATVLTGRRRLRARRVALARALAVAVAVVGADQITKAAVVSSIPQDAVRHVIPGIELVHVQNTGVAFSLLAGGGALVIVVTIVALVLLSAYLLARPGRPLLWLPTGLLIGGAVSNLANRLIVGSVTDFIKLPDWPAFNVADIAITVGVVLLVAVLELGGRGGRA
jgi:signal peptidase II